MKKISLIIVLFFSLQLLTAQEEDVKNVNNIEVKNKDVPFAVIENVPVFPGCSGTKQEKKMCLNRSIQKHVAKNFNLSGMDSLGLKPGRKKIYIQFKITKKGKIDVTGARAPHKKLENESIRVVKLLPEMIPGTHRGRNVNVTYMLPISFTIE